MHSALEFARNELVSKLELAGVNLPEEALFLSCDVPENPEIDEYRINADFDFKRVEISGTNPRAVLFGAYRLLNEIGFRWIRPGKNGEVVPEKPAVSKVDLSDRASCRYRGICIEGAASAENVLDMIHWMIKLGFNTYFIQFRNAFTFFDRWYTHKNNPLLEPEEFTAERAVAITIEVRSEIRRLGLDLHMVGHGWTCEPFGIRGDEWEKSTQKIPEEVKALFAEVNGKRELWGGIALNTNLCYGRKEVRTVIADAIRDYAVENPDVNVLHFWLADGMNNHCECPLCTVKRPADWYIDMLNEVDRTLTAAGLDTKIVFLIYVDLLWPPEKEKLVNQDRFILMFAPITRSYDKPFVLDEVAAVDILPPFDRNHLEMPWEPEKNLSFLALWQKEFTGNGFDFDYHYMWDHFKDPGYYSMAQVLHKDCQNLHRIGLNGFISCQVTRAFFPHALGMTVIGRTLWNDRLDFEEIESDFFVSAYGSAGAEEAKEYFRNVSEVFHPTVMRTGGSEEEHAALLADLPRVEELIRNIAPALEKGLLLDDAARRESWEELAMHNTQIKLLAEFLRAALTGGDVECAKENLFNWAREHEMRLQSVFDVYEFINTFSTQVAVQLQK